MPYSQEAAALTIEQQHEAVILCCEDLAAATRSPAAIADIGQIRLRLAGLLHANLASEEVQIIGPIRRLPVASRPRLFTELGDEAADLRSRYSQHVRLWNLKHIDTDQRAYARAATELMRDVRAHIERKRSVLREWRLAAA